MMTSRFERQHEQAMRLQRSVADLKELTMIPEEAVLTQERPQSRREKFIKKQTAETVAFELLEKVATAVIDATAPLSVEVREQPSPIYIHIRGAAGFPTFASRSTVAESATRMTMTSVNCDLPLHGRA
jgi:hypothetical protein